MPNFKLSNEFENYELSSGTLRTDDLIYTFVTFLKAHAPDVLPEGCEFFGIQHFMQIDTGIVDSYDGWYSTYLTSSEKEWGGNSFEDGNLVPVINDGQSWVEGDYWEEQAQWDLDKIFDIMDEIAPERCYFGSIEGDGSCFGFWKLEEDF